MTFSFLATPIIIKKPSMETFNGNLQHDGIMELSWKCWYGVESKPFEILKEMVKGKEVSLLVEKG